MVPFVRTASLMLGLTLSGLALPASPVLAQPPAWTPPLQASWQIQLQGTINTSYNVSVYDLDLFDTPQTVIDRLRAQGRRVICYFSAGSWENWRPDAARFPASVKGRSNGWPGEKWLDIRQVDALRPIMAARLDLAVRKRCDAVDPDNMDGYANRTGFPLKPADQIRFNTWMAREAHARGLAVGLKNDLEQIAELQAFFDFAVNEQCFEFRECAMLKPFTDAGKPVFGIEYTGSASGFCPRANAMAFSTLKKSLSLDATRLDCMAQYP